MVHSTYIKACLDSNLSTIKRESSLDSICFDPNRAFQVSTEEMSFTPTNVNEGQSFNLEPSITKIPHSSQSSPSLTPSDASVSIFSTSSIVTAVYSDVHVWEILVNGIQVMRRCADSFLNVTQLLKVANIEKGKRTKILEKEIFVHPHEKVQGGYGKYQGTWVSFDLGYQFAQRHGVVDLVKPLLDLDPATSEDVPAKLSKKSSSLARRHASANMSLLNPSFTDPSFPRTLSTQIPRTESVNSKRPTIKSLTTPRKRRCKPIKSPEPEIRYQTIAPVPLPVGPYRRKWLMEAFIDENAGDASLDEKALFVGPGDLDLPLDSQGYTALHWAAAFGRATAIIQLISHGADPNRPTPTGLTPLMRSVLHSHSRKKDTFFSILNSLSTSLDCRDISGRTVFHHLVIGADQPEHKDAGQFYLYALTKFLKENPGPGFDLINATDTQGDTPCHLASRLGLLTLLDEFQRVGANLNIRNRSNLTPSDYLPPKSPIAPPNSSTSDHCCYTESLPPIEALPSRVDEITSVIQKAVTEIEADFRAQIVEQHQEIIRLRQKLDEAQKQILALQCRPLDLKDSYNLLKTSASQHKTVSSFSSGDISSLSPPRESNNSNGI